MQHEARRRAREPEGGRFDRHRGLLPDTELEVGVRPTQALRNGAGDPLNLDLEAVIDPQLDPGGARDQLDGAVVVRRPKPARDDAEIRPQAFG